MIALALAGWVAADRATASTHTAPARAMSPECHQAYRGCTLATDPAEADLWAESWTTFGCESGGYWA